MPIDPRISGLIAIAKTINPTVGLIADLAATVIGSFAGKQQSQDLRQTISWLEKRSVNLLEQLIIEHKKPKSSEPLIHELEVRLHETLDILMDLKQERPWDG
jgi:hypothetical protein